LKCGPFFTGKKKMEVTQQFGVREERMYAVACGLRRKFGLIKLVACLDGGMLFVVFMYKLLGLLKRKYKNRYVVIVIIHTICF
jgi:hypothetical protein